MKDKQAPATLTDQARVAFKNIVEPAAAFFNGLGISPNAMTLFGLGGTAVGAVFLGMGQMTLGGLIVLVMGLVDGLDGTMARLRGMAGRFGAFVDSVSDRYAELFIFAGLLYYYTTRGDSWAVMGVYTAAAGSVLVSYIRARGQSLNWDTKVGLLTRMERYLVLAPSLVFNVPLVGIWIIAVFANITALQRIVDIRRQAYEKKD